MLTSSRHRTQERNMQDALQRLNDMLDEANVIPLERIETEVPEWSKKERLTSKRNDSQKKSLRRKSDLYD